MGKMEKLDISQYIYNIQYTDCIDSIEFHLSDFISA